MAQAGLSLVMSRGRTLIKGTKTIEARKNGMNNGLFTSEDDLDTFEGWLRY